jgi:N-acetylglucosamine-6-phosphate deacetylase
MGYVDIQVNGYAGVDFLGELVTREQLRKVADQLWSDGVTTILPTITTDEIPLMAGRMRHLRMLIDEDPKLRALMPAFHIEGPFISEKEGYRGAHFLEYVRPATPEACEPLIEAAGGWSRVAMLTLAPEVDKGMRTTRWLSENGVVVALGHTDASLQELRDAEAAGAQIFTHLGNGCANQIHRHDNVLNRALSLEKLKYSLITDGHHLPWFVVKIWLKLLGVARCVVTTDCVSPAAAPPGRYKVGRWEMEVGEDRVVRPPGKTYLGGSALTMPEAYRNLIEHVGMSEKDARALTVEQPRALIARFLQ